MKIFAAGIATESNTFCPIPTSLEDFSIQRGRDVLAGKISHPSLDLSQTWGRMAAERGDTFVFSLMADARPSGITVRSVYETLREEVLTDLRAAMPADIVLLMLHGAMLAQGYDDCEKDLINRVRGIVGPNAVIGVELDLHCHLSETKLASANIAITYKEYPHVDVEARAAELFELAVATKLGIVRPVSALFDCRMIGIYPTTRQPLRGFVDAMREAEKRAGVLSISFAHGFHFADVPHLGAKILVFADGNAELAAQVAQEFGRRAYAIRHEIAFSAVSLPMEQALSKALSSAVAPVVVADQSDNPGGGAPGDATFALRWLLDHHARAAAMGIFYDPEVVRIAKKAGPGTTLPIRLGGKMGPASGDPIDVVATVRALRDDYRLAFPQQNGAPQWFATGDVVALECGGVDIVVSSRRCQCFGPAIFTDLGIDLRAKRVVVVKSAQHFYGAFAPIAADVIYMTAPGAVPPDPRLTHYKNVETEQLYPWTEDPLAQDR